MQQPGSVCNRGRMCNIQGRRATEGECATSRVGVQQRENVHQPGSVCTRGECATTRVNVQHPRSVCNKLGWASVQQPGLVCNNQDQCATTRARVQQPGLVCNNQSHCAITRISVQQGVCATTRISVQQGVCATTRYSVQQTGRVQQTQTGSVQREMGRLSANQTCVCGWNQTSSHYSEKLGTLESSV